MEFCISILSPEDLKKEVDHLRYHYDRTLIREKYPYIPLFGPVESFVNLKQVSSICAGYLKKKKRFRLTTDTIHLLEQQNLIFLNIFQKGEMEEIHDFIAKNLESTLEESFFPHILIAKNHQQEELEFIHEELKDIKFRYSFFCETVGVYWKENHSWEEYSLIEI